MSEVVMSRWASVPEMLQRNDGQLEARDAILSHGASPISHRALWKQTSRSVQLLNGLGLARGDCLALVMPPGPELAVAFLALASGATVAPLNPSYLEKEFAFYLQDLQASALVVLPGDALAARQAATSLGVPILEWHRSTEGDDQADLRPLSAPRPGKGISGLATPEEVALVLHTSGTTSRPKIVPLTHRNLCASATHIGSTLELKQTDRCLNAMPLFHIHGLVAGVLASLGAGGSTVCTPGFDAEQFLGWLERWQPTWFTAVPTMHQAILGQLQKRTDKVSCPGLRFIRSSSAALPPSVMAALENAFDVPVLESYGMTEAAHQMASNPLPPRVRKPGSVGPSAGPEVAILDAQGGRVPQGTAGEVAIRGPNVTSGYRNNPEANAAAFSEGWLRTGDQGYLDADGYLFLTGRLKEMINRGGEKIAPREIDEMLLTHPAVRQAVAFAVPHASLGEDLAAVVVLRRDASVSEVELLAYMHDRLPAFKVPSRFLFLDDVPKGPTGKVQRIGLASRLRDVLEVAYLPPATEMERLVAATMSEVLGLPRMGRDDNFLSRGGDSLRATQVLSRLRAALELEIPHPLLLRLPTVRWIAARLEELQAEREVRELAEAMEGLTAEEQRRLLDGAP